MDSSHIQTASCSSPDWKYSVFLSFRGEDTRNNFVGHLYRALDRYGIHTFKDDIQLERGEDISPGLLKAIEGSRVCVVVISQNYAFSSWCLDELVKIMECRETKGQIVIPIFYNVDPSHVKKQEGTFATAFVKHGKSSNEKMWRNALTKVATISGWDSRDRDEATLVAEIVRQISDKLFLTSTSDMGELVGIVDHLEEMSSLLCLGSNDVRMVGIWGMGGIGKTTIARAVYDRVSSHFKGKCFLANVKESFRKDGAVAVREKLLSKVFMEINPSACVLDGGSNMVKERLRQKRSIIVLDDVGNLKQLEILAKRCDWFGLGSRIIITTRDKHLLIAHGVEHIYEVNSLENDDALQLFNQNAFRGSPIPDKFSELSKRVMLYAKGLPLALKILGSFLCSRSKREWESALKKLESIPNPDVHNVLRVSYDDLDDEQKDIFLDIACFYNGWRKDLVIECLDSCGFCSDIGISVLVDKSLLTVSCETLEMHDLLQEMGWKIVRQESIKDPGKRSRLWIPTDVQRVLTSNMGSERVEGILLDLSKSRTMSLGASTFAAMYNLRFLKFYDASNSRDVGACKVNLPNGLESLSPMLRYLHWHQYPLRSLPNNFSPENLVVLDLPNSNIEQLWDGDQDLVNLKQIDLSYCTNLVGNIDLSLAPNLERVMMNGCTSLHEAPAYISHLSQLKLLSLRNCERLSGLPNTIHLKSLTTVSLSGCSSFTEFPEFSHNIKYLDMSETALVELPSSIECLTKLDELKLEKCTKLQTLPRSICKLKSLASINLSGCGNLANFPEISDTMDCMYILKLERTGIKELHPSIENLTRLKWLHLQHCKNLEHLPSSIWSLQSLEDLFLSGCPNIRLPPIPTCRTSSSVPTDEYSILRMPQTPHQFFSLRSLHIQGTNVESIPANIKQLSHLYTLKLTCCRKLKSLPKLPLSLNHMVAHDCTSLETVSTSWQSTSPSRWSDSYYYYSNCFKLSQYAQSIIVGNFLRRTRFTVPSFCDDDYMLHNYKFHHGYYSLPELKMYVPGSEIPEFFRYQSTGSFFTAHLPWNWYNSDFMGFAVCAVITFDRNDFEEDTSEDVDHMNSNADSSRNISNFLVHSELEFNHYFTEAFPSSDHIVMGYDANLGRAVGGDEWLGNKISFKFTILGGVKPSFPSHELNKYGICKMHVKKCGVGLIYKHEHHRERRGKRRRDWWFK